MSRTYTRDLLFRLVFSYLFNENNDFETIIDTLSPEEQISSEEKDYIVENFETIKVNLPSIESKLQNNLINSLKLTDIYPIDRAILYCAIAQIDYAMEDKALILNESVKLAKKYSTDKSSIFINGVLSSIYND